ncbi:uncharacterized protein ana isoform X1 [Chironomus tepperi]|uniref:uncharacterized protein ana isoform X1 n=1 Tax=Chironomus tepperi TaxID=113505 RepID=UPI00391F1C4F
MEIKISSIILTIITLKIIVATPVNKNNNNNINNNENSQTVVSDEVTAYPDMQKLYVDLTNVSPDVSNILRRSQLNVDQIREQQERLRHRNNIENDKNRYEVISSSTSTAPISQDNEENYRLLKIQSELEATLRNSEPEQQVSAMKFEKPQFEYAFAAACEIPRHMNITKWFDTPTWNIMFKPIYRRYNVLSSTIRLYKIKKDEDVSVSNECDMMQNKMYTLSVSVYIRKRKEITKKIIFTRVIQASFVGWVEVDALGTLSFWDQAKNNHGIAVEIFDENDQPLDAREHFRLQSCDQADAPILPWGAFKFLVKHETGSDSDTLVKGFQQMYNNPRLDIISSTPPIYENNYLGSKNNNKRNNNNDIQQDQPAQNNRPQRHIRHENHHKHHVHNENKTTLLKNKFHKRKEHMHRDENSTTGET